MRRVRIDLARERTLYVDAVRRASAEGWAGRRALEQAHEAYALAMVSAGRPTLAAEAVSALLAARPTCEAAWSLAARVARAAGDVDTARKREAMSRSLAEGRQGDSEPAEPIQ